MGLDMYLYRTTKEIVSNKYDQLTIAEVSEIINNDKQGIFCNEIAYWRKANQIRGWFEAHLSDFRDNDSTLVTKDDLEFLLEDVKDVLHDHNLAPELLPTTRGFFFGGDSYDSLYFGQLKQTRDIIEDVLANTNFEEEVILYHEWY